MTEEKSDKDEDNILFGESEYEISKFFPSRNLWGLNY